jgi:Putative peptidoglycan binding domain
VDGEQPRRRRGAKAAAAGAGTGRRLALRILLHSPKDTVAGMLAFAAACAVITNAVFLQAGPHPAPMFGATIVNLAATPSLLPRARPAEADAASSESRWSEPKGTELRPGEKANELRASDLRATEPKLGDKTGEAKSAEPKSSDRNSDSMANLVRATTTPSPSPQPAVTAAAVEHSARPATPQPSPQPSTTASLSSSSNVMRPPASIPPPTGARRVAAVQRALTEYGYAQLKPTGTIGADTQAAIQKFERDRKLPVTGQISDRMVRELAAMIGHPVE